MYSSPGSFMDGHEREVFAHVTACVTNQQITRLVVTPFIHHEVDSQDYPAKGISGTIGRTLRMIINMDHG